MHHFVNCSVWKIYIIFACPWKVNIQTLLYVWLCSLIINKIINSCLVLRSFLMMSKIFEQLTKWVQYSIIFALYFVNDIGVCLNDCDPVLVSACIPRASEVRESDGAVSRYKYIHIYHLNWRNFINKMLKKRVHFLISYLYWEIYWSQ